MAEQKQKHDEGKEEKPLNENIKETVNDEKSFKEKLQHIRDNITVEPLLAGLIVPSVISMFAMGNLNLDKACRVNLRFGDEVCNALIKRDSNNFSSYEKEVQRLISSTDIWKSVMKTVLPSLIIMFLGAWSDRTGKRKIVILLPICGEVLTSINNIINVYFFYEIPVEITVFLETFFVAATGGWMTIFLGVFSYISDITSEESRTFRVGLVNFCMTVGLPFGIGISGVLLQRMGYYGIFSMTAVMLSLVLLYGCVCLKEPNDWLIAKGLQPIERTKTKVSFFNVSHVLDTVAVAYKQRPYNRKTKVLLTLFVVFIVYGPTMSEHGIFYMYVRNQLNWDMVKYGFFASYSIVLHSFGALFSITVLSKKLQIDDSLLCFISVLSKFVGSIWTAFVRTNVEMYLVPVVELFNATTFTSLRSIISKLVDKQETAKVNSLFSLTETMASLIFHPLYSWMYMRTLHVLPGTIFLVSATLIVPAACVLLVFYIQHRKERRNTRKQALDNEEKKDTETKKPEALEFYVPANIEHKDIKDKK